MKVKKKKKINKSFAQDDRFKSGDNSHIARPKRGELPLINGI